MEKYLRISRRSQARLLRPQLGDKSLETLQLRSRVQQLAAHPSTNAMNFDCCSEWPGARRKKNLGRRWRRGASSSQVAANLQEQMLKTDQLWQSGRYPIHFHFKALAYRNSVEKPSRKDTLTNRPAYRNSPRGTALCCTWKAAARNDWPSG